MSGIEKELDPVFDQYKKKRQEIRDKTLKKQEDYEARENEFKNLFETTVYPIMLDCVNYLRSKGEEFKGSWIKTHPHFAEITFRIDYFSFTELPRFAEIKFTRKDESVNIVERNASGSSKESTSGKSELTPEFVCKKLTGFIKSFLNTDNMLR